MSCVHSIPGPIERPAGADAWIARRLVARADVSIESDLRLSGQLRDGFDRLLPPRSLRPIGLLAHFFLLGYLPIGFELARRGEAFYAFLVNVFALCQLSFAVLAELSLKSH
ncbi:MAG: hypothetical protein [Caudoviricetes sp.]|nr:MAG: hypothetical protein [Caudoviricetes sp.]